ncbi:hypothetical protein [Streptomyces sp. WM6373]|nr:hypothetical protein [Streptomyces sp. WM6373]
MIRSAEVVNEEIRALLQDGRPLPEDVDRYHRLVVEYAEALQAEREQAA